MALKKPKPKKTETHGQKGNTFYEIGRKIAIRDHIPIDQVGTLNSGFGYDPVTQAKLEKEVNDGQTTD